jgi:hypothetical protein
LDFPNAFTLRLRAPASFEVYMIHPTEGHNTSQKIPLPGASNKSLLSQTSWPLFFVLLWASHMTFPNMVLYYKPAMITSNDLTAKEL